MKKKHRNDQQLHMFTLKMTPAERRLATRIANEHGALSVFLREAMEKEGVRLSKAKTKERRAA